MYVFRVLIMHPFRLILTLSGIALCIILIMFILGVYQGVATGSVEYVRKTPADIWVLQANTTNIMRGTSMLPEVWLHEISKDSRIASATAVLIFFANIDLDGQDATVLLTGYVPGAMGGPPQIAHGRNVVHDKEIVLDQAFARKHDITPGQRIRIRDDSLDVVGLSSGTNAFVTQYAFVTLAYEQSIVELSGLTSFFILTVESGYAVEEVMSDIENVYPGRLSLYAHPEFLENNIREVEAGVLPLFYAIAVIGAVVLAIILSLILSVNILERRRDYAIMKIIGSPAGHLYRLVIVQSLLISSISEAVALLLIHPLLRLIAAVSPEVDAEILIEHVLLVTIAIFLVSIGSGLLAGRRVRGISPSEVFV